MDVNQVFGGDAMKAADLNGQEFTLTIVSVEEKKFDKGGNKLAIRFAGAKKSFICNKTNSKRIAMLYGSETGHWPGKTIVLYPEMVDYQGEPVWAIRVKPPASFAAQPQRPAPIRPTPMPAPIVDVDPMPDQTMGDIGRDEIPF